jgi:hypothetical protein
VKISQTAKDKYYEIHLYGESTKVEFKLSVVANAYKNPSSWEAEVGGL